MGKKEEKIKITTRMIEKVYSQWKETGNSQDSVNKITEETGMNESSAIHYLNALSSMEEGKAYTRTINKEALESYLYWIKKDFGNTRLKLALKALKKRIISEGSETKKENYETKLYKEFTEFLNPIEVVKIEEEVEKEEVAEIEEVEKSLRRLKKEVDIEGKEIERFVKQRVNQGFFRRKMLKKYAEKCCICNITDKRLLIASHIKPWSKSTPSEKVNGNNGLLLCPHHDTLFDKGLVSFSEDGEAIVSTSLNTKDQKLCNISNEDKLKIELNEEIKVYLKFHREEIFQK